MITLVLADAELELVPESIAGHPAVRASGRKRSRPPTATLLDSSLHHPALKQVEQGDRRGRPDIVHVALLVAQDSIANLEGQARVLVHTRNDDLIRVLPETRIPRNFNRFCGLMEDLFAHGAVPPEASSPLMRLERGRPLRDVLAELPGRRVAFDHGGARADLASWFRAEGGDVVAVVGAFPHGDFRSPVRELCPEVLSLHEQPLKAWTAAAEILVAYRHAGTPLPIAGAPSPPTERALGPPDGKAPAKKPRKPPSKSRKKA